MTLQSGPSFKARKRFPTKKGTFDCSFSHIHDSLDQSWHPDWLGGQANGLAMGPGNLTVPPAGHKKNINQSSIQQQQQQQNEETIQTW